jgi:hypothetical protein
MVHVFVWSVVVGTVRMVVELLDQLMVRGAVRMLGVVASQLHVDVDICI